MFNCYIKEWKYVIVQSKPTDIIFQHNCKDTSQYCKKFHHTIEDHKRHTMNTESPQAGEKNYSLGYSEYETPHKSKKTRNQTYVYSILRIRSQVWVDFSILIN